MDKLLLQSVLLASCFLIAQSLVCTHSVCGSTPKQCTKSTVCKTSKICFTEIVWSKRYVVHHKAGYSSTKTCRAMEKKGVPCGGHLVCLDCCDKDRCNRKECLPPDTVPRRSCKEHKEKGHTKSGVYTLDLGDGQPPFQVYCDMETAGGGWTVFQKRINGSVDFFRGWDQYKKGFGNLRSEFWLGNDYLHRLTKAGLTTLRVDLSDWEGNSRYAQYSTFGVGPAAGYYRLTIGNYSGTAGDSLALHNGMAFTTKDADHDTWKTNCAQEFTGAWWYAACHYSNLNGHYYSGGKAPYAKGVVWYHWKTYYYSMKSAEMKLREP